MRHRLADRSNAFACKEFDWKDDEGFTVIELMVALAVFSVLAVVSAAAMGSIFSAVRTVSDGTQLQVQAQNSAEWLSRLARYTAVPPGREAAVESASPTSMNWFTWSGSGANSNVPYRARVQIVDGPGEGEQSVVTDVAPGVQVDGEWAWSQDWVNTKNAPVPTGAVRRVLLTVDQSAPLPLGLRLLACAPDQGCRATERDVTPTSPGAVRLDEGELLHAVEISLGRTDDPQRVVRQRVGLVNLT